MKSLQSCPTLCDPMDYSQPGSSIHGFFRQEYWSGFSCPPPGDLPRDLPPSPELAGRFFTTSATAVIVINSPIENISSIVVEWSPYLDQLETWLGSESYSPAKGRWNVTLWALHVWQAGAVARVTQTLFPLVQRGAIVWWEMTGGEFPGGPMLRTWCFHCCGPGFDPWLGNKDPKLSGMAKKRLVGTSLASTAGGTVLMPGWGIRILHDAYWDQKNKTEKDWRLVAAMLGRIYSRTLNTLTAP